MHSLRRNPYACFLSLLAAVFFALLQPANTTFAASATHVKHKAIDYFMPDHRIRLEATVNDPKGVKVVRAYFKAGAQADYLFVPMEAQTGVSDTFVATLPAIKKGNDTLQYLFLVVNNDNQVVKTNPFTVKEKDMTEAPSWQMVKPDGQIQLYTELENMPPVASTYSDSVAMNVVESSARFGVVASLYGSGSAGGGAAGASAATGASNAGVVAAAGAGLSTTAIVAAAAVAAGAAAAGGGGGGGGGGGSSTTPAGSSSFVGTWSSASSPIYAATCSYPAPSLVMTISSAGTVGGSFTLPTGSPAASCPGVTTSLSGSFNTSSGNWSITNLYGSTYGSASCAFQGTASLGSSGSVLQMTISPTTCSGVSVPGGTLAWTRQ